MKDLESIAAVLKEIIEKNGPGFLADEPYRVYKELIESTPSSRRMAAAILYFLVSGLVEKAVSDIAFEDLSRTIQKDCSLNKKMSDQLATVFISLYTDENKKEWESRDQEGLERFLKEDFACKWKGLSVWDAGTGTVDCRYEADVVLTPSERIVDDKELKKLLSKNPFTPKEKIHDIFEKRLYKYLDQEFEEYCTEDDYYQPVAEDFEVDYFVEKWAKKNGFEIVSCEGTGYDDGYEPKVWNGGY